MKNVEDLFSVEAALRTAAREFAVNSSFTTASRLRDAARSFARAADFFEGPKEYDQAIGSESPT